MKRKKIEFDKYYTPNKTADYCINKTFEIIGEENITSIIEPSAGEGAFSNKIECIAYDIFPEDEKIIKQDYLKLNIEYEKGRLIIGNPPFGDRYNDLISKFFLKSIEIADYIAFILPIRQYKNDVLLYQFDLIYSEDLGFIKFSNSVEIRCCFNIFRRPKNGLNSKPNYKLDCINIEEHHRKRNVLLKDYDFRFCSFGSSLGKECIADTYCKEYCLTIDNRFKKEVINLLRGTDFKKEFPSVSSPYVGKWQLLKYIKENIKNIY